MKKILNLIKSLTVVLLALIMGMCCFAGCAEYKPPENTDTNGSTDTDGDEDNGDTDTGDEEDESSYFTVQLITKRRSNLDFENFTEEYYKSSTASQANAVAWAELKVQWTDENTGERYYASIDENGKAKLDGLDGDYTVTLVTLPTGFIYDPNSNTADNIDRNIEITVYKVQSYSSTTKLYIQSGTATECTAYKLSSTGAYSATLESSSDKIMFAFTASGQGTYSFTTLIDITEDLVNPLITVYKGNLASKAIYFYETKDGGGAENEFTKNVYWEYTISTDEASGSNALIFELYSKSYDGESGYPITVNFLIQRDGDFSRTTYDRMVATVTEDFTKTPETPQGTFTWAAYRDGSSKILDESAVILNTAVGIGSKNVEMGAYASEGDGYYYYYDYDSVTGVYTLTDRVYAALNIANEVFDITDPLVSFRTLESGEDGVYYNYTSFVETYRTHCNSYGLYPLNEELKTFLQRYSVTQRLFNDGAGVAETGPGYNSDEDSQWLFACGYYKA